METVAWMVGREGGVTELLFDAPQPPFQISKELVFRDDAEALDETLSISKRAWAFEHNLAEASGREHRTLVTKLLRAFGKVLIPYAVNDERFDTWLAEQLNARADGLQAKLDLLMFEHCPDEMTAEQKANWARHQVPAQIVGAA